MTSQSHSNPLPPLQSFQAEMDQIRSKENAEYTENKAALEAGVEGVKKATQVLKEYYAKGDAALARAEQFASCRLLTSQTQASRKAPETEDPGASRLAGRGRRIGS